MNLLSDTFGRQKRCTARLSDGPATTWPRARVSPATVKKFEAQDSDAKLSTVHKWRRALESAGVEFIEPADGKGPGVRLKKDCKRK
jgi:hypothetical protein